MKRQWQRGTGSSSIHLDTGLKGEGVPNATVNLPRSVASRAGCIAKKTNRSGLVHF